MKNINFISRILFICLFVLLCGCSNKTLVGTWDYYDKDVKKDIVYVFNKNNTGKYTFFDNVEEFTYECDDKTIKIKSKKTSNVTEFEYNIKNEVLTMKDKNTMDTATYKRR